MGSDKKSEEKVRQIEVSLNNSDEEKPKEDYISERETP